MRVGNWRYCGRCFVIDRERGRFSEANERLRVRLRELAEERRRWGYRRLHVLLKRGRLGSEQQAGIPDLRGREADRA